MKLAERLICISIMVFLIGGLALLITANVQEQSAQYYIETQLIPEPTSHRLMYVLIQISDRTIFSGEDLCKKDLKTK